MAGNDNEPAGSAATSATGGTSGGPDRAAEQEFLQLEQLLLRLSPAQLRSFIKSSERVRNPAFIRHLLQAAQVAARSDRARAADLCRVALGIIRALRGGLTPLRVQADLRALARAEVANAHRIAERFKTATRTLRVAADLAKLGTGDLRVRARLLDVQGSLLRSLNDPTGARRVLGRAAVLYRRVGDAHGYVRVLLHAAIAYHHEGAPNTALRVAARAAETLRTHSFPDLEFALAHNTMVFLEDDGQHEAALFIWPSIEPLYLGRGVLLEARGQWVRAKMEMSRGNFAEAAQLLEAVRHTFLLQNLHYDAALVGVELALAYAHQHHLLAVELLARDLRAAATSEHVPSGARETLLRFVEAAHRGSADVDFIRKVCDELAPIRKRTGVRV